MKKIYLLYLLTFFGFNVVHAGKVTTQQALLKAQQFMPGKQFSVSTPNNSKSRGETSDILPFYIFNVDDGQGFVIVSGDDRTEPILGYSEKGNIEEDMPINLKKWLEGYARDIMNLPDDYQQAMRSAKTRGDMSAVSPLIQTTWNQGNPYNLKCPMDGDQRSITGCTATAQAQVMYYHKWPESSKAIPAYVTSKKQIAVDALPATTFKWDLMKTSYSYDEIGAYADAVAELMRYCGQANYMDYTATESGAAIHTDAFIDYFNYSVNMRYINRNDYTTEEWECLVYQELKEKRPVLYSGGSEDSGHQFICDGYDGNGLFHLNWGWGGYQDGYFVLTVANPERPGLDSGTEGYNKWQSAVIGVQPGYDGEVAIPVISASSSNFIIQTYQRESSSSDFENIQLDEWVILNYNVIPSSPLDIEVGWGLYQNEQRLQVCSSGVKTTKAERWSSVENSLILSFGKDLSDGMYQLRQIYRLSDNSEWNLCSGYRTNELKVEINGKSMLIRQTDNNRVNFMVNSMACSDYPQVGAKVNVKANITNEGEYIWFPICLWSQKDGSSDWIRVGYDYADFDEGETVKDIIISYTPEESGTYQLKLTNNYSLDALASVQISVSDTEEVKIDGVRYSCSTSYKRAIVVGNDENDLPEDLVLPSVVSANDVECKVVAIGDEAFCDCYAIRKVIIPEGVESIGQNAFSWCGMLQRLELPSTLKSIGNEVIRGDDVLSAVVSHMTEPLDISETVFGSPKWDKNGNKSFNPSAATLYVPDGTINKYQAISGWTYFAKIEEGELKEEKVGDLIYSYSTGSDKASVVVGDYLELTSVVIPSSVTIGNKQYDVTTIASNAFQGCYQLTSVSIEESVKSIGRSAFEGCYNLTSLTIPEGVQRIGDYAFWGCSNLEKLELPSTLTSLGSQMISYCNRLAAVISRIQEPFDIKDNTFTTSEYVNNEWVESPSNASLYVPTGTLKKYKTIYGWTRFTSMEEGELKEEKVGALNYSYSTGSKKATVIAGDYSEMESITVPASITIDGVDYQVKGIGHNAFEMNWDGKTSSVTLPEGIVTIGDYAFRHVKFSQIKLPSTLKTIGRSAFEGCYELTSLTIPKGVQRIGDYVFWDCSNLETLELPSTLTRIGTRIVAYCDNLSKVISRIRQPIAIDEYTFLTDKYVNDQWVYSPLPATLYVPVGTKAAYEAAVGWKEFIEIVEQESESITISAAKQLAYMSDKDLDFTYVEGLKAYVATGFDKTSGTIWLTRVNDVPANTGILLMGEPDTYKIPYQDGGTTSYYQNMFKGTLEGMTLPMTDGGYTNYYLSNGQYGVGFYKVKDENGVELKPNRAYLSVPTEIPAVGTAGGTETIKVSAAGQVPYYSANSLDFTNMADVKAYTATGYDYEKGTIWLTRVKKVPALTGILIMAPEGSYPIPTTSVATVYENMFMGTLEAMTLYTTLTTEDGKEYTNYYLSNGEQGVGFYKVTKPEGVSLGANRCYLPIPKQSAGTRSIDDDPTNFSIQESDEVIGLRVFGSADGTTDIETNNREPITNNHWYNLQGQRVENPGKGLYIKNGKMVIIK